MTRREAFRERLRRERTIAIVRADAGVEDIVRAVWTGGIGLVEVSLTSRDALAAIERLAAEATPERQIGAGTVLDARIRRRPPRPRAPRSSSPPGSTSPWWPGPPARTSRTCRAS